MKKVYVVENKVLQNNRAIEVILYKVMYGNNVYYAKFVTDKRFTHPKFSWIYRPSATGWEKYRIRNAVYRYYEDLRHKDMQGILKEEIKQLEKEIQENF